MEELSIWFQKLYKYRKFFINKPLQKDILNLMNSRYQNVINWYPSNISNIDYGVLIESYMKLATDLYLTDLIEERERNSINQWLNDLLNRTDGPDGFPLANTCYKRIITKSSHKELQYVDNIITKYSQLTDENKKIIGETLFHLIVDDENKDRLNISQRERIIQYFINDIGVSKKYENWLINSGKLEENKELIKKLFNSLDNSTKLNNIGVVKSIDKSLLPSYVKDIIRDNISNSLSDEEFDSTFNKLLESGINNIVILEVESILNENSYKYYDSNFDNFILYIIDNKLININIAIINKYKAVVSDDNSSVMDRNFALRVFQDLDIPNKKKNLVKELLCNMKTDDFDQGAKEIYDDYVKGFKCGGSSNNSIV